ncbi:MAG: FtsH protease activity modulator HflK, partial [Cognatishimia sp.]
MAGNSGGPWGGGGNSGGGNRGNGNGGDDRGGGRRPEDNQPQIPDIDDLMKKGQDQLRVLMGGRGGSGQNGGSGGQGGGQVPTPGRGVMAVGLVILVGAL